MNAQYWPSRDHIIQRLRILRHRRHQQCAPARWSRKGSRRITIQKRPSLCINLRLARGCERRAAISVATDVHVPHEERLVVDVGIDDVSWIVSNVAARVAVVRNHAMNDVLTNTPCPSSGCHFLLNGTAYGRRPTGHHPRRAVNSASHYLVQCAS